MPSTLFTAAIDIFVIAGVAAVATAILNPKNAPFKISLGAEYDDDSLLAPETNDAGGTQEQHQSTLHKRANDNKKTLTVNVNEIIGTPPFESAHGTASHPHISAIVDWNYEVNASLGGDARK